MSPESPPSGNVQVIASLLAELDALGITEYCVAAGARNAPLLSVLMARAEAQDLTIRHFFEERCASFFALGRVIAGRKPVAVVTTSGTAVAELYPAVMEAYYQAAPLVVVTADRPSAYRGSGAPQA
ncbi:MAG TPA: thiamine pyrophosphate-binding protein, partial [Verrucomicrobium sp.]|nr:thiamine pyrophosphate-binding protein [Verrucomicrobium sp.]